MKNNKFIARGITKEGKFIYGFYAKVENKHFILLSSAIFQININVVGKFINNCNFIEIIKEPDKCLDFKDKNGKMLYEEDEFLYDEASYGKIVHIATLKFSSIFKKEKPIKMTLNALDIEIIGNTHNLV